MKKKHLAPLPLQDVRIKDDFWNRYCGLIKNVVLPYQWDAINDRIEDAEPSHSLENFRIAAGESQGDFKGAVFQDTDVAKWLEAVAYTLATDRDPELEKTADEVIDLIGRAQCEDGYINTYYTIREPENRWTNLKSNHELYTAGHLLEAAVAYYEATGKRKFLEIMMRFADLICKVFGPGENQLHGYPGHQEIELALVKLYRVTGDKKYLDMAKYFIDTRGVGENYFLQEIAKRNGGKDSEEARNYDTRYAQSHLPVREQETAEGHAVRFVYMCCAMADIAEETDDAELLEACKKLWNNAVEKRMYLTGSIGSSGILERFTTDYDLPNDCNYSESCASIGLALFGLRMARITKDASYLDIVERALYNTVLSGIAMDGKSFFYVNPLEVWPDNCMEFTSKEHVKAVRQKWFGVACCPPNIARTLASLGQYIYSVGEDSLFVNLFVANETELSLGGRKIQISLDTKFPVENKLVLRVRAESGEPFTLAVRVPEYAGNYKVSRNGKQAEGRVQGGFFYLTGAFENDALEITFDAPARIVRANPLVRADEGKLAIMRGPLVYCLEEQDNGKNLASLFLRGDAVLEEQYDKDLFGGAVVVTAKAKKISQTPWQDGKLYAERPVTLEDAQIKAIPYCFWDNRTPGEMLVWLKELF